MTETSLSPGQVVHWLFYLYWFGVLVFGANFLLQIAVLVYQSYRSPVIGDGRFRIVETSGDRAPCSFGNIIFINPSIYDWETYNQILIHEKVHVSGWHTIDILLAEIVLILQWFNPFAWLYRKEVENNLEFLTDQSVLLHREVERSAYQLSLLRVSAPHLPFSITTNYNQSLLKRRIVMMNSQRSSQHTIWKYFFLLPVLTFLVCALNKPAAFGQSTTSGDKDNTGRHKDPSDRHNNAANLPTASSDTLPGATSRRPMQHKEDPGTDRSGQVYDNDVNSTRGYGSKVYTAQGFSGDTYSSDTYSNAGATSVGVGESRGGGDSQGDGYSGGDPVTVNLYTVQTTSLNLNTRIGRMNVSLAADTIANENEGSWFVTSSDDKMEFELRGQTEDHSWSNSFTVTKTEINPFPGQGNIEFKLVREAGTIVFKGQFDGQQGFGHYKFTPDESFFTWLKQQGIDETADRRAFSYFTADVKKGFVTMIIHNGYPHITGWYLTAMARQHIDEAYIRSWKQAGYNDISERDLISARNMHVDPAYAQEMKAAGYDNLTMRELLQLKNQRIIPQYVRSLHVANGSLPPVRDLAAYRSMDIDSDYLASLQKLGYTDLSSRDIISLHSMHVTVEFIKGFQALGYKEISARNLISLKSRDITPDFIKGFKEVGYTDIDLQDLSSFKIVGLTPEFVKDFKSIGYDHIPAHELRSLKAMGIDAAYVSKMKEKGFVSNDLSKYIRLKHAFE
jgi:hypothetical protein